MDTRGCTRGFDYIGVGVGAVIVNDRDEVLLVLRKQKPEIDRWTIPGGAVEWFETCENAIKRECLEEVGLKIEVGRLLTVVDHIVEDEKIHWVSLQYLAEIVSGMSANTAPQESGDLRWFPIDQLPERITRTTEEALRCYRAGR